MHDAPFADRYRDQIAAREQGGIGFPHRCHRFRGELVVRDQMDALPITAIDRAEDTVAESRCVFDDRLEHRLKFGRRAPYRSQHLGSCGLLLSRLR